MQAVILAGGLGTRLRPLTLTRPKPLVPVANVPVVRRIIEKLPADVTKVILAVNYRVDALREYFADETVGREIVLVEEKEALGTGGAVKNVEREIDGPFFVFNGDVLDSLSLSAFREFHAATKATASIALWKVRDPRHYGVVAMTGSRISKFVEKPATKDDAPSLLANAGTYLLEPEVFDFIPPARAVSIERETFPGLISAGRAVHGHPFQGYWVDVGRPETLLKANETVLRSEKRSVAMGAGARDLGARFPEWAVVGPRCELGANAEITRSVLLDGVVVGENASVRDSILGSNVRVEPDAAVVDCVLADGVVVRKGVFAKAVSAEPGEVIGDSGAPAGAPST